MIPVATLKAFAKTRRVKVGEQLTIVENNWDDPMTVQAKFTQHGRKVTIRASSSRFHLETPTNTALWFSIGTSDRVLLCNQPAGVLEGTTLPLFAPWLPAAEGVGLDPVCLAWLGDSSNRAPIDRLRLESSEALHVAHNGMWAHLRGDRALDDTLLNIIVSIAAALETVQPAPAPPPDPFDGPPELDAFLNEFGHLAEGDDELRHELSERLTRTARAKFLKRVTPLFPAINSYLDSLAEPWSDHAIKLSQLGELGAELSIVSAPTRNGESV